MEKSIINPFPGKGIYTLLLELEKDINIMVGALGILNLRGGYYSYTGSARGTGGFGRVRRHLELAAGLNKTRHWHIDYLLPYTVIKGMVLTYTGQDLECPISQHIGRLTKTISGFGCTDCRCGGHLHADKDFDTIISAAIHAHSQVKGENTIIYSDGLTNFQENPR